MSIANVGVFAVWAWVPPVLAVVLLLVGLFLILLVLIQRGKGGGLAGAFGGAGGSSAFGSKSGDAFTRFTIYVAIAWAFCIFFLIRITQPPVQAETPAQLVNPGPPPATAPAEPAPEQQPTPPAENPK